MDQRYAEILFTVILTAYTIATIGVSTTYASDTRLVPLIFAVILLAILIVILIFQLFPSLVNRIEKEYNIFEGGIQTGEIKSTDEEDKDQAAALITTCWTLGLLLLMSLIGFINGIFLFSLLFYRLEANQSWKRTILYSVAITASIMLLFQLILQSSLYNGIIIDALGLA